METVPGEWVIRDFDLGSAPRVGLKLAIAGPPRYVQILRRAFPTPVRWYGPYDSFDPRFDYVLYAQEAEEAPLRGFLAFATQTLLVPIAALDECWALAMHTDQDRHRTPTGELVHRSKTYPTSRGDPAVAAELARIVAQRARDHPTIARADLVSGVPANPPKEPHNLPELLAEGLAAAIGRSLDPHLVRKIRPTRPIKDLPNEEKLGALEGAYEVTHRLDGGTIVVVDDLLQSGTTMGHIANLLRRAGAGSVIGLVATKTLRSER